MCIHLLDPVNCPKTKRASVQFLARWQRKTVCFLASKQGICPTCICWQTNPQNGMKVSTFCFGFGFFVFRLNQNHEPVSVSNCKPWELTFWIFKVGHFVFFLPSSRPLLILYNRQSYDGFCEKFPAVLRGYRRWWALTCVEEAHSVTCGIVFFAQASLWFCNSVELARTLSQWIYPGLFRPCKLSQLHWVVLTTNLRASRPERYRQAPSQQSSD